MFGDRDVSTTAWLQFRLTGPVGDFLRKHGKDKSLRPWNPERAAPDRWPCLEETWASLCPLSLPHAHSKPPRFNEAPGQELGLHNYPFLPRMLLSQYRFTFLYLVCGCRCVRVSLCACRSENNLLTSGLSFYSVCLGDQTQVRRLSSNHLYP